MTEARSGGRSSLSKRYREARAKTPDSLMAVNEDVLNAVGAVTRALEILRRFKGGQGG